MIWMPDRLEEIKERYGYKGLATGGIDSIKFFMAYQKEHYQVITDMDALFDEVERLTKERNEFRRLYGDYVDRFTNAVGDINRLRNEINKLSERFRDGKIGEITDSFLVDEVLRIVEGK